MADKEITLEESLALTDQILTGSSLAISPAQSLPNREKDKDVNLGEDFKDQMSKVCSQATSSLQSLHLPLLPPCFSHQELLLLLRRQRKVLTCFVLSNKFIHDCYPVSGVSQHGGQDDNSTFAHRVGVPWFGKA